MSACAKSYHQWQARSERWSVEAPVSHYGTVIEPDGTRRPEPYSCVPGTPPIDHATLTAHDERTNKPG